MCWGAASSGRCGGAPRGTWVEPNMGPRTKGGRGGSTGGSTPVQAHRFGTGLSLLPVLSVFQLGLISGTFNITVQCVLTIFPKLSMCLSTS